MMVADRMSEIIGCTLEEYFVKTIPDDRELCVVGAGLMGRQLYPYLIAKGHEIAAVSDNNWMNCEPIEGKDIQSIEEVVNKYKNNVYFVILSRKYAIEMKAQLLDLGVESDRMYALDSSVVSNYRKNIPEELRGEVVSLLHESIHGSVPDLENPVTFNEKILCQMIKTTDMEKRSMLSDKLAVRAYVEERIGEKYLVPLLGNWNNVDEISFSELPEQYVLKANHGCGWNVIVNEKNPLNMSYVKAVFDTWLKTNYSYMHYEMHYRDIKPQILCEMYLENETEDLHDYKVFCFKGEPLYIMYLCNRKNGLEMAFFDVEWNKMPFVYTYPMYKGDVEKPKCITEMLEMSRKLAAGIGQVRVDWYILNDGTLKFGEMTFTSAAGYAKWTPIEWNYKLGKLW